MANMERAISMIDKNTALNKALIFVTERIVLREDDELIVSFLKETDSDWIFFWESKRWIKTKDSAYSVPGPRRIRVDKATGEVSVIITHLQ